MRLVMIDADERLVHRERNGLRGLEPDEQGDAQSRPLRGGDGIKLRYGNSGIAQRGFGDGNQVPQMFARGKFGHNAAVFGMEFDLRGDGVGQDFSVTHDGGAGFVAGGFDG
jgi:hypothetical protein